jgi:hypothetical protein
MNLEIRQLSQAVVDVSARQREQPDSRAKPCKNHAKTMQLDILKHSA